MKNEDFNMVFQGKKVNGEMEIDIYSVYKFEESEILVVLNALVNFMAYTFDYNPLDLLFDIIPYYYRDNPDNISGDIDKLFNEIFPGVCFLEILGPFNETTSHANSEKEQQKLS